jgi:ankyrin repeat protein
LEDQEQAVLSTCSSLVAVVDENGDQVVQFSHFSVKEFLVSPRLASSGADVSRFQILLGPAHTILARACLGTLLRLDDRVDEYDLEGGCPLARYAAEHWVDHAQFESVSAHLRETVEILFNPDGPCFSAWIRVHDMDVEPTNHWPFRYLTLYNKSTAAPLYNAALCGFCDLAEHLIDNCSQQVNANGGFYASPLVAALSREDYKMVQLLYERGANVDVRGDDKRAPLYGASWSGHLKIVQWLLRRGADSNALNYTDGWTALHEAAMYGFDEIAQTLLKYKADPNMQDIAGRIPLHLASKWGKSNVTRIFLEHGVDVNARNKDGSTPLHLASMRGELKVARLLIEHGAGVGTKDNEGMTPLQVSSGAIAGLLSDCRLSK